jgi:effector-binding domain-containing protein
MMRFILLTVSILLAILIFVCSQELNGIQGKIVPKKVHSFFYVLLVHRGPYSDQQQVINNFFSEIQKQNIIINEPVLGFYYNDPTTVKPEQLEWGIGATVPESLAVSKPLILTKWEIPEVLSYNYRGNPDSTGSVYTMFDEYMAKKNLAPAGPAVERYLNLGADRDSLRIEIWFPIQQITE